MLRRLRDFFRRDSGDSFPAPQSLVVGLGNPGPKYAGTRHNVGFRVVECLAERHSGRWQEDRGSRSRLCVVEVAGRTVALVEPQTYVNRSGESVAAVLERWPHLDPERDLIIVYDDLDLPIGRIRLRSSGGGGGHNGMGDILERLGSRSIPRLRFGIGHPGDSAGVIDWVLGPFAADEEESVLPTALEWAADAVEAAVGEGVPSAMGRFNANRPDTP